MTPEERARSVVASFTDEVHGFRLIPWGHLETVVANAIREEVAAERRACVKVFEDTNDPETGEFLLEKRAEADRLGKE